jgi:hypothetical protein
MRATQQKMDDAFHIAMHRTIRAGRELVPTVVSTTPGTPRPKVVWLNSRRGRHRRLPRGCLEGVTSAAAKEVSPDGSPRLSLGTIFSNQKS